MCLINIELVAKLIIIVGNVQRAVQVPFIWSISTAFNQRKGELDFEEKRKMKLYFNISSTGS